MKVSVVLTSSVEAPEALSRWLLGYLRAIGVEEVELLRDSGDYSSIRQAYSRSDAVIVAGAAGDPDAVRVIAELLGLGVEVNEEALSYVRSYYSDTLDVPENLESLALTPEFSYVVPNERGPVPAFVAMSLAEDKFIAGLPPKPSEAVECFERGVQDFIREKTGRRFSATMTFHLACDRSAADALADELGRELKSVFARFDLRFLGREGVPLTLTVYAGTAEELYDTMVAAEEMVRKLAAQRDIQVLGGGISKQATEESLF
uniref:MoaB/Mog domain-containing protein n=1 Tax=Thermofilum pendens TaxID=2269 RepID=A0A7C3WK58_THEPE